MPTDWNGLNIANFQGGWNRPEDQAGGAPPQTKKPPQQQAPAMRPAPQMHAHQPYGDWMHPMQREGLGQYHAGIQATNRAVADEMQSRVDQTREWDQRAHEQQLAGMKHQSEMAQVQAQMQMQREAMQAKNQRNAALMKAAGIGGTTLVNGRRAGFGPFRNALLG